MRAAILPLVFILAIACGSSDASSSGAAADRDSFIAQYCQQWIEPCCARANKPSDGERCRAFLDALTKDQSYDPAAGGACLEELRGKSSSATFCDGSSAGSFSTDSCKVVFQLPGAKQPGEPCTRDSECANEREGNAECVTTKVVVGEADDKRCQVQTIGRAGEPCIGSTRTDDFDLTEYVSSSARSAPRGAVCRFEDGLRCDSSTATCVPLLKVGEVCSGGATFAGCARDAYCDSTTKSCAARKAAGATCAQYSECVQELTCSSSKVCSPRLAEGAACSISSDCVTDACGLATNATQLTCLPKTGSILDLCGG